MTEQAISPLRRRMIEDMSIRKFAGKTQHALHCGRHAALPRITERYFSPGQLSARDVSGKGLSRRTFCTLNQPFCDRPVSTTG
jgi:hypothetical protein